MPVSARDFVFTHRAFVRASAPDSLHPMVATVRRVTAIDAKTVRVELRSPLASWQELFIVVLPRHALAGEQLDSVWRDGIDNPKTGSPIGSGPFLVERWERGKQLTLRRNPRYWGPHPAYLDRIVVRFQVTGPSLRDAFRRGEIDVATHMPPGVIPGLRGEPGLRVISNQKSPGWDHFEFRMGSGGHPALRSKLVRRALAFGVDRAAIVRSFILGSDPKAVQRDSAVFATRSPYYQRNWRTYEYRPSESRRLLELAGCRRGPDGVYSCDGRRLSLRFMTTVIPGGFRPAVLDLVQAQLRRVGVEVTPSFAASGALFDQIVRSGDFDVALFAWVSGPSAAHSAQGIFACGGSQNFTGYCQRLVTAQLDQATRILDPQKQARTLNAADRQLARDVPVLPLYQQTQAIAARDSVRNVGLSLITGVDPLWNAENWWLDR
jgi:peptide/nickel transport system substrate-binding protein